MMDPDRIRNHFPDPSCETGTPSASVDYAHNWGLLSVKGSVLGFSPPNQVYLAVG